MQLHSFTGGYPVVLVPFVEKTILSPFDDLCIHVENQLTVDVWIYIWTVNYIPLICISLFVQYQTVLINVALQLALTSRCLSPTLFLVFKIVLAILYPLKFYTNLESTYQFLQRSQAGILMGIVFYRQISLGNVAILTTLSFLIHEHGCFQNQLDL